MDVLMVANHIQVELDLLETLPVSKPMETCLSWEWALGEINVAHLAAAKPKVDIHNDQLRHVMSCYVMLETSNIFNISILSEH